jgi:type I restriction enzyme M protein
MSKNKYCSKDNLRNESDVEQFFVIKLLEDLGYDSDYIRTKTTITEYSIGKKASKKRYSPDYIVYNDKKQKRPVLIIDAKTPKESVESGVLDAQLYASVLRRKLGEHKPEQFCIGTNGMMLVLKRFDSDDTILKLSFEDFTDENTKFKELKKLIARSALSVNQTRFIEDNFEFKKPGLSEIRGIFEACHNVIWRKEVMSPESAFYEFSKLMFVKLNEDKRLHKDPALKPLIEQRADLPISKVYFSEHWIEQNEEAEPNPINSILFKRIRESLEWEIKNKKKKRIFESDENIDLESDTIKEVVKLIEHFDLISIDEDLNGRLFETFLSATMRGRQLGQFFTPRNVVDFITDMADLQVSKDKADYVLDACCGTGGFLIEAMAKMIEKISKPPLSNILTEKQKEELSREIRDQHLLGIDAGKKPPISRIARINMYLHGDGGSRIYFADSLDKEPQIPDTIPAELREEREELKNMLSKKKIKFDVVLTNPPFAMRYKRKVKDQERILMQYALASDSNGKLKASLKSNVMFLERYAGMLNSGGKLITVIDESVLNTDTDKNTRDFIFDNFYIKAIISLPRWAFFQAGSNVKTTILYLVKKSENEVEEEQPFTFYAKSENIGYDRQKPDKTKSDLSMILETYKEFSRTGILKANKPEWNESSKFFIKKLFKDIRRIDFEHLDPRHDEVQKRIKHIEKSKGYKVDTLDRICTVFTGKTAEIYVSEGVPIIKSKNITNEGITWDNIEYVLDIFFGENISRHLKENDVLINTTGVGTLGRVALFNKSIPCMTDGHITALRINPTVKMLPDYLLYYLRSVLAQTQIEKYTVGSTGQTELNDSDLKKIVVLYPEAIEEQKTMLKIAKEYEVLAMNAKKDYLENLAKSEKEFAEKLTTE